MPIFQWKNDIQFNYNSPTLTDVEIDGTGDSAKIQLENETDNSNDVPFTNSTNYTYDGAKIEVTGGKVKLKSAAAGDHDFTFTTSGNYAFDGNKIEFTGGVAKLKKDIPSDLKGYYKFEDSVEDSSGNNYGGINYGTTFVSGKVDKAAEFNGTSHYINISNSNFIFNDIITVEAWIKLNNITGIKGICTSGEEAGQPKWLFQVNTNKLRLYVPNAYYSSNTSLSADTWYFVVFAGTKTGGGKFYLNGIEDGNISAWSTGGSGNNCSIGKSGGGAYFDGLIDEIAIYQRELSQSEIQNHYNSGSGKHLDLCTTTDPDIYPNTGFAFINILNTFTETSTKPSGSEIKYQTSSDDGVTWKWWNGTAWVAITGAQTDSWYYINESNLASVIHTNISDLAGNGTFKFRGFLHSDIGSVIPEINNIHISETMTYPTGSYEISMNNDIQPTKINIYKTTTETITKPTDTDLKYQYSIDSGSNYNGSWLTEPELETTIKLISCNFDGTDKIRFKFQLSTSDSEKTPQINNLNIVSGTGYKSTGSYEPKRMYMYGTYQTISFELDTPEGTTAKIYTNFGSSILSPEYEFIERKNNELLKYESTHIGWKIEMTSGGKNTPSLNVLEIKYMYEFNPADRMTERRR